MGTVIQQTAAPSTNRELYRFLHSKLKVKGISRGRLNGVSFNSATLRKVLVDRKGWSIVFPPGIKNDQIEEIFQGPGFPDFQVVRSEKRIEVNLLPLSSLKCRIVGREKDVSQMAVTSRVAEALNKAPLVLLLDDADLSILYSHHKTSKLSTSGPLILGTQKGLTGAWRTFLEIVETDKADSSKKELLKGLARYFGDGYDKAQNIILRTLPQVLGESELMFFIDELVSAAQVKLKPDWRRINQELPAGNEKAIESFVSKFIQSRREICFEAFEYLCSRESLPAPSKKIVSFVAEIYRKAGEEADAKEIESRIPKAIPAEVPQVEKAGTRDDGTAKIKSPGKHGNHNGKASAKKKPKKPRRRGSRGKRKPRRGAAAAGAGKKETPIDRGARHALMARNYTEAIVLYQQAWLNNPAANNIVAKIIEGYTSLFREREADSSFEIGPTKLDALLGFNQLRTDHQEEHFERGLPRRRELTENEKRSARNLLDLGFAYYLKYLQTENREDLVKALDILHKGHELFPEYPEVALTLSTVANEFLNKSADLSPEFVSLLVSLTISLYRRGFPKTAHAFLAKIEKILLPGLVRDIRANFLLSHPETFKEAGEAFRCLAEESEEEIFSCYLGKSIPLSWDAAEIYLIILARTQPEKLIEEGPRFLSRLDRNVKILYAVGRAWEIAGDPTRAKRYYEEAWQKFPEMVLPQAHLLKLYRQTGKEMAKYDQLVLSLEKNVSLAIETGNLGQFNDNELYHLLFDELVFSFRRRIVVDSLGKRTLSRILRRNFDAYYARAFEGYAKKGQKALVAIFRRG